MWYCNCVEEWSKIEKSKIKHKQGVFLPNWNNNNKSAKDRFKGKT
jgi:hypothetical protein